MATKRTPEVIDAILARMSDGETLRAICRSEGMPHWTSVYDWIDDDPELALRFERARERGAEAIAEDILDITDDGTNDWMEKIDKDGKSIGWVLNGEHVQRSKLRADVRLRLLAKWHPKRYGEKTGIELTGANGGPVEITETERAAKVAALVAVAQARKGDSSDLV